jgi:beta-glucanase (GH16 family)
MTIAVAACGLKVAPVGWKKEWHFRLVKTASRPQKSSVTNFMQKTFRKYAGVFLAGIISPLLAGNPQMANAEPAATDHDSKIVWSDEFAQADGSAPDAGKWVYETGGNGWGNNELEYYTSRTNNVRIEDGKLVIEARSENFGGKHYTSARLLTKGKWSWTYGRVEARIKIPRGQGIWPAFWMMGTTIGTVGWPACGEIDIMENIGREPALIHGTVHGPGYSGSGGIGGPAALPGGAKFADDFHVYAIECETNRIRWFVDDRPYFSLTPAQLPKDTQWVFNQPKFLLLNLAVGGAWPGNPDNQTIFPQRMAVDYVRVYKNTLSP